MELVAIDVPGDGSCLFHSLCMAFFLPYIRGDIERRREIVKKLRSELAGRLSVRYHSLAGGNLNDFSSEIPEFSLDSMEKSLGSSEPIGYGYMEHICDEIDKDVYVLDGRTGRLYTSDESSLCVKKRPSIVLIYERNHYSLLGLKGEDKIETCFSPDHNLLKCLK